jgi:hypothetical protein
MEPNEKKIWFPAKKYGRGWGPPVCWLGWVVFIVWLVLIVTGGIFLMANHHPVLYVAYTVVLGIVLFAIVYLKGEKPRWRWGKD